MSHLSVFEWRILNGKGGERISFNDEIHQIYESPNIIIRIVSSSLRWTGHVKCMACSQVWKVNRKE